MDNPKNQIVAKLKDSTNILVTVRNSPSVDQLSAAIGMTLVLNKTGKHATAVFSGEVPSTIEFLKPEETLERTTDSLRDFIIALDKAKADKLRYKVEDKMVKIFITPYRTTIGENDLEFSQGDFNVDTVIAIGVHQQEDLDATITEHGGILHDATVITVNTTEPSTLGSINWSDSKSSSLSEMAASIAELVKEGVLDEQISTAFLTGIVAETDRFSNEKTSSSTMSVSAKLMAAGANQQLVANALEPKPEPVPEQLPEPEQTEGQAEEQPSTSVQVPEQSEPAASNDGSLQIEHEEPVVPNEDDGSVKEDPIEQIHIDEQGTLTPAVDLRHGRQKVIQPLPKPPEPQGPLFDGTKYVYGQPSTGGTLTANTQPEQLDPSTDPLSLPPVQNNEPLLTHDDSPQTLADLERDVNSPHLSNQGQDANSSASPEGPVNQSGQSPQTPPPVPPPIIPPAPQ